MKPKEIVVDGVVYRAIPASSLRAVVVVDRGWIFAGDITEEEGRIRLDRAVWIFRWEALGFDGVIANPKDSRVKLRSLSTPVDIPADAEIFRVPVSPEWGLP